MRHSSILNRAKWLAVPLILSILLSACTAVAPTTAPSTGGEQTTGEVTELTVTWPMEQQTDILNQLAATYAEEHPDFKVTFQHMESAANEVLIKTQLQSGEAAIIVNPFGGSLQPIIEAGMLYPWDEYLEMPNPYADGTPWIETLHQEWLLRARWSGDNKLYTLPIYADMAGIFYNASIFEELGITLPTTWDEWMAVNDQLQAAGYEAVGWMGAEVAGDVWLPGILSDAVFRHLEDQLVSNENFTLNLDDPFTDLGATFAPGYAYCAYKAGIINPRGDEVRFMFDRLNELKDYFQRGFSGMKWEDIMVGFANQRIATFYGAGWLLPILQQTTAEMTEEQRFEVGFFPIPGWGQTATQPEGYDFTLAPMRSSTGGGAGNEIFALNAAASEEERQKAVDFVMWMVSPQAQSIMWNNVLVGMFPISRDVPDLPEAYKNPPPGGSAILQLGYEVGSGGWDYYLANHDIMTAFFLGEATVDETIEAYAANWEASWAVAAEKNGWTCEE